MNNLELLKLYNKAFKTFPNSPKQKKIIEKIDKMKKLKKGSIEAKRYMAKIRSMRKTKKRKVNGTSKHNVNIGSIKRKGDFLIDYEPYFDKDVIIAYIEDDKKIIRPAQGYFPKHPKSKKAISWAKRNGYKYMVDGKIIGTTKTHKDTKSHNVNIRVLSGDNSKIQKMYLDYVNNFLSIDKFAEHYGITKKQAISIINKGKKINETSIGDYKHNKSQFFEAKKPKNPRKKRTRKQNEWKVSRTKSGRFKKGGITKLNGISVTGTPPYKDENAVREIRLYADNNSQLYFSRKLPILKNLQKKYQKGTFDVNKASKLWRYYIDDAMQRYHKEFGGRGKWYNMLDTSDRQLLANEYAEETLSEFQLGNFV